MTTLTLVPRYADVVDDSNMARWLAAHAEVVEHWEARHRQPADVPGACCLPLLQEEALLFARVERPAWVEATIRRVYSNVVEGDGALRFARVERVMTPPAKAGGFSRSSLPQQRLLYERTGYCPTLAVQGSIRANDGQTVGVSKQTPNNFYPGRDFGPGTSKSFCCQRTGSRLSTRHRERFKLLDKEKCTRSRLRCGSRNRRVERMGKVADV